MDIKKKHVSLCCVCAGFNKYYWDIQNKRIGIGPRDLQLVTNTEEQQDVTSSAFTLKQNYPNPFNPSTSIGFELPVASEITLKVHDMIGREIATLISDEFRSAGNYSEAWNASMVTSGVYFYRLKVGEQSMTRNMLLMK